MNILNNTATAVGNYNNIETNLESNTSSVNLIEGLSLTKSADKTNWVSGNLTYTITLSNNADSAYENPVITDVIDTTYVEFIKGSVMINEAPLDESKYSYGENTHTLTFNLDDVSPSSNTTITFLVKKKI